MACKSLRTSYNVRLHNRHDRPRACLWVFRMRAGVFYDVMKAWFHYVMHSLGKTEISPGTRPFLAFCVVGSGARLHYIRTHPNPLITERVSTRVSAVKISVTLPSISISQRAAEIQPCSYLKDFEQSNNFTMLTPRRCLKFEFLQSTLF